MKKNIFLQNIELRKSNFFNFFNRRNIEWMNNPEVTRYLKKRKKYTFWEAAKYFYQHNIKGDLMYSIYLRKQHIGNCGFFEIKNKTAELRFTIGESQVWGKGIGKIAINKLLSLAKINNFKIVWLYVNSNNKRAVNLYTHSGFQYVRKVNIHNTPQQIKFAFNLNKFQNVKN